MEAEAGQGDNGRNVGGGFRGERDRGGGRSWGGRNRGDGGSRGGRRGRGGRGGSFDYSSSKWDRKTGSGSSGLSTSAAVFQPEKKPLPAQYVAGVSSLPPLDDLTGAVIQQSGGIMYPRREEERKPIEILPPQTTFHLECMELSRSLRNENKILVDEAGIPRYNCRSQHGYDSVCQFCDGGRGKHGKEKSFERSTEAFLRYQESIVNSRQALQATDEANETVLTIAAKAKEADADIDDEFGMNVRKLSLLD